jgi:hypothetical protein
VSVARDGRLRRRVRPYSSTGDSADLIEELRCMLERNRYNGRRTHPRLVWSSSGTDEELTTFQSFWLSSVGVGYPSFCVTLRPISVKKVTSMHFSAADIQMTCAR